MTQTLWITSGFALFICEPLLIFWHTLWLWNRLLCNSVDWTVLPCKTPSGRLHEKRGDLSGRDWPRVRWGPDLSQITPSIPGSSSALRFTLSLWVCPHLKPVEGSKGPTLTVSCVTDNCHQSLETWLCVLNVPMWYNCISKTTGFYSIHTWKGTPLFLSSHHIWTCKVVEYCTICSTEDYHMRAQKGLMFWRDRKHQRQ